MCFIENKITKNNKKKNTLFPPRAVLLAGNLIKSYLWAVRDPIRITPNSVCKAFAFLLHEGPTFPLFYFGLHPNKYWRSTSWQKRAPWSLTSPMSLM